MSKKASYPQAARGVKTGQARASLLGPRALEWPHPYNSSLECPILVEGKGFLVPTQPPCLPCCHLRMSMKEGMWVMLATAAPRLMRRMKGSSRWLQAESQEPAGTKPSPATQLQLV